MNKQTREILLLAGALIILAAVAVWQVRQMNASKPQAPATPVATTPAPANAPVAAATPAVVPAGMPAVASSAGGTKIAWVDQAKVNTLVGQVKKGRNPFLGAGPVENPAETKPGRTRFRPRPLSSTAFPPINSSVSVPPLKEVKLTRTLEWVTPQELAQAFADAKLEGVKLMARKGSEQVIIVGMGEENFKKAVELANAVDVPPPAPNFQLKGIVSTDEGRYVALWVDGKFHTLKEGSVVPNVGWVVTRVTPNRVTLVKEKQSVQLLLAGGHV